MAIALLLIINPLILTAVDPPKTKNMEQEGSNATVNQDHLVVVWSSGDPEVAHKMVFMYTYNAKKNGWWKIYL